MEHMTPLLAHECMISALKQILDIHTAGIVAYGRIRL